MILLTVFHQELVLPEKKKKKKAPQVIISTMYLQTENQVFYNMQVGKELISTGGEK